MKKKIYFLTTNLNIGGSERFLECLVAHLKGGNDITVGYINRNGEIGRRIERSGVNVEKSGNPLELAKTLKKNGYDCILTFLYWGHIFGRLAGRLSGTKVMAFQQAIDIWKNPFYTLIDKSTLRWCDMVVANSHAAENRLVGVEGIDRSRVRVVHNGVDFKRFDRRPDKREELRSALGIEKGRKAVICVARLHYDKGTDYLPEIARGVSDAIFVIAGDGPQRRLIENRIKKYGIERRFRLLGMREDVQDLLPACDVFLLPSREESFPQAALEAMAAGLPVIAAKVGGIGELVEDGREGILVEPGNASGYRDAVIELAGNEDRRKEYAENAYKKSRGFSSEKMFDSIDNALKEL
ncbi:MAG: glycosyltransferase [Endomicrobiales bacterium]|nr:glycosyltransferase [Endomicrobiales bacterium]